jgi:hypothetical protein
MEVEECQWYFCLFNDGAVAQTTRRGSQLGELPEACPSSQSHGSNTPLGLTERSQRFLLATQGTAASWGIPDLCSVVCCTVFCAINFGYLSQAICVTSNSVVGESVVVAKLRRM